MWRLIFTCILHSDDFISADFESPRARTLDAPRELRNFRKVCSCRLDPCRIITRRLGITDDFARSPVNFVRERRDIVSLFDRIVLYKACVIYNSYIYFSHNYEIV